MTWNPFDWTAGPFLSLYLILAVIVLSLGFGLRSMIGPAARRATQRLGVLELAYLAGGAHRLGDAVLLSLMSGKGASLAPKDRKITVTDQMPLASIIDQPPLLSVQPGMTRQQFQTSVEPLVERVQWRLRNLGYCATDEQMTSFRMTVLPFVGFLLVFGMIKVWLGAERHHPVGLLFALIGGTAIAGIALATRPKRTRAGRDVLETYRSSRARLSRAPLENELLLAVALTGAVVLSGTAYAEVYAASKTMNNSGSGCGGGSCGGGGGGGGCGGCGGGD